jgi:hypothetical protein
VSLEARVNAYDIAFPGDLTSKAGKAMIALFDKLAKNAATKESAVWRRLSAKLRNIQKDSGQRGFPGHLRGISREIDGKLQGAIKSVSSDEPIPDLMHKLLENPGTKLFELLDEEEKQSALDNMERIRKQAGFDFSSEDLLSCLVENEKTMRVEPDAKAIRALFPMHTAIFSHQFTNSAIHLGIAIPKNGQELDWSLDGSTVTTDEDIDYTRYDQGDIFLTYRHLLVDISKRIGGFQANMWLETTPTYSALHYLLPLAMEEEKTRDA